MTRRLVISYVAVTVLTLLALVIPLGRVFASREQDRLLRDIERDTTVVGNASEDALERGATPDLGQLLSNYQADPGGRIVIVDRSGRVVADSEGDATIGTSFTNRPEIAGALQGNRAEGSRYSDTAGTDLYYAATPATSSGIVHGSVRITYPGSTLDRRVRDTWLRLILLSVVVLAAVVMVGVLLARGVTRPVHQLIATSRSLARGDLSARASDDGGVPEMRELAGSFNDMAARLEQSMASQQAFVADASHQLRTPLAALRLQLENLEAQSPDELQPKVAALQAETTRLARLAEGLLVLTRATSTPATTTVIDAAAVAAGRVDTWAPTGREIDVTVTYTGTPSAPVTATPGSLEQMLDNLLANALEVAPTGSTVGVRVEPADSDTEVHVIDHGPGLDEAARGRAFDRFWRAPDAPPGGTGLGLAIVRQLAEQSGGHAELRAVPDGGLDAVITLRTAPTLPVA
jgi:signal transduction histidine kinase